MANAFTPNFKGLLMGTATVHDLEGAVAGWRAGTDFVEIGRHAVEPALLQLWGADPRAHTRAVILSAEGADRGFLRLVDTDVEDYEPDVKDGRAPAGPLAYEYLSRDVDEAAERIRGVPGFRIVGGPLDFDNGPAGGAFARAMRIVAPGGFTCLINTIKTVPAPRVLPRTEHLFGPAWNAPVTAMNRAAVEHFYGRVLGMPVILDGLLDQEGITETNDFPTGWSFEMLVYGAGAFQQMIENEIHPDEHLYFAPHPKRRLLRGNAAATLLIESLDGFAEHAAALGATVRGPFSPAAAPYGGHRAMAVDGPNREMIELLEVG